MEQRGDIRRRACGADAPPRLHRLSLSNKQKHNRPRWLALAQMCRRVQATHLALDYARFIEQLPPDAKPDFEFMSEFALRYPAIYNRQEHDFRRSVRYHNSLSQQQFDVLENLFIRAVAEREFRPAIADCRRQKSGRPPSPS